ncbi:hypothetical protein Ctob_011011 [Chrysochromulina tobinii]|uniref:EF-hand domain-containing protein n=1 Tax=Chrysochromulina tobinii TaxID=1460289 RepID=A0A0M0J8C0_9EUKA|nr:hypothetical protein Ctob_011011 [Chrysochromulina tobinii]|eukprot:KOO22851.1 hypothetical protein Ctob_011011 [Chrysochromulina sp. CCMP291]
MPVNPTHHETRPQWHSAFPTQQEFESQLDAQLAAARDAREHKVKAEASLAADAYVEQRAKDAARASKQEYTAHTAVPQRVRNAFEACDFNHDGYLGYRELRTALRMYGIDVSARAVASVLAECDANPDGKLDLVEFHQMVRDAEQRTSAYYDPLGTDEFAALEHDAAGNAFRTRPPLVGLGSGGANQGSINYAVRDELMRDNAYGGGPAADGVRARLLQKDTFWKGDTNGEWVRNQLVAEQLGRAEAEQEARIAKAEAAAAIARVEALRAAQAARELEIEAAAARLVAKNHPLVRDFAPGAPLGGPLAAAAAAATASRQSNASEVASLRQRQLVERLEVALLEKLDQKSPSDSDAARAAVLRRVFRSAPIGGARSRTHATRAEFHAGLALLGLPQRTISVHQLARQKPVEDAPLPGATTAPRPAPLQRTDIESDAAIDRAVVDALFDKYAEQPPVQLLELQARYERDAAEKVVDFSTIYERISRAAVRPGSHRAPSLAMAHSNYMARLDRLMKDGALPGGSVFDARKQLASQERWAQARGEAGETRRGVPRVLTHGP